MKIKIEHIFVIVGIELLAAAILINVITGSYHYFSGEATQTFFNPSNGFMFLMQWASIYGLFAVLYFVFGMIEGRFKEDK